jgi:OmpA-OmpF porin, OOP family
MMIQLTKGVTDMRITKAIVLIALLLAPLTAVYAQRPGIYLGGAWGAYRINESNLDDNDDLYKLFAGIQFTDWFGLEGSWTDFSRLTQGSASFDADGKGLAAVFTLPFSDKNAFFAKAGQFWWETDSNLGTTFGNSDGEDLFFGAGFIFGFNRHVALRLEVERYDVSSIDLDAATIGLQFKF